MTFPAQPNPFPVSNGHFNLAKGDSADYSLTKVYNMAIFNTIQYFSLDNGSTETLALFTNMKFTINIIDLNRTVDNYDQVYFQFIAHLSSGNNLYSQIYANGPNLFSWPYFYIEQILSSSFIPLFGSKDQTYDYLNSSISYNIQTSSPHNTTQLNMSSNSSFISINQFNSVTQVNQSICFNWHTGWMQSFEYDKLSGSTLVQSLIIQKVNKDFFTSLTDFLIAHDFEIIFVFALVGIFTVLIRFDFKKYKKNSNKTSFNSYIHNLYITLGHTLNRTKNSNVSGGNIDINKSLEKIEEILKENDVQDK